MTTLTLEIGSSVVVKKGRFMPMWLARLLDTNAGERGNIVSVEVGQYSKERLYGVVFGTKMGREISTGVYFADQLEFPTCCAAA